MIIWSSNEGGKPKRNGWLETAAAAPGNTRRRWSQGALLCLCKIGGRLQGQLVPLRRLPLSSHGSLTLGHFTWPRSSNSQSDFTTCFQSDFATCFRNCDDHSTSCHWQIREEFEEAPNLEPKLSSQRNSCSCTVHSSTLENLPHKLSDTNVSVTLWLPHRRFHMFSTSLEGGRVRAPVRLQTNEKIISALGVILNLVWTSSLSGINQTN